MSSPSNCQTSRVAATSPETQARNVEPGHPNQHRRETEMRDRAILHQQRRLKQATQFVHKDSADLLPLDQLKRLGTSKDLQPHSVVQRRLLEGNLSKLQVEGRDNNVRSKSPLACDKDDDALEEKEEYRRKEAEHLLIACKCHDQELRAGINTGCQHNLISRSCVSRLGLEETSLDGSEEPALPFPNSACIVGQVERLTIQLGQETVECRALVVDDEVQEFSFGLQTLLSLKSCIDLSEGVLRLKALGQDLPFIDYSQEPDGQ
ncbi:nuclear receptor-interacting protein 2 [Ambystoma mexicanum]|uniref:nuclear receptor-interacting protein 2 n=1 Tax=Ambystoma mexicanum TaxID=8296 RepID=UPI0037E70D8D